MTSSTRNLISLILVAGIAGAIGTWYLRQRSAKPEIQPVPAVTQTVVRAQPSPSVRYRVPSEAELKESTGNPRVTSAVPRLDESDQTIEAALGGLFGEEAAESVFVLKDIVRRFVATIDTCTEQKQPTSDFLPVKNLGSAFRVATEQNGESILEPANFRRYNHYVELIRTVNARKLVAMYVHFYPVFQSAYRDLGTSGYFNDRLIDVIDHILATPEPQGPILVTRLAAHASYKFADDQLEKLSAVQKLMIRMGNQNAGIIKAKLRQIRALLVRVKE